MDLTPLEQDADRALKELLPILRLNEELEIVVFVRKQLCDHAGNPLDGLGCLNPDLRYLGMQIQLSSAKILDGPTLWETLAHELAHVYQAELLQAIASLNLRNALDEGLTVAYEMANTRVHRLILRSFPCPPWLKDRAYEPPGGDA